MKLLGRKKNKIERKKVFFDSELLLFFVVKNDNGSNVGIYFEGELTWTTGYHYPRAI